MKTQLRLLIVEDSSPDAEIVLGELSRFGYQPDWRRAETEAEFVAFLQSRPDAILAKCGLPQFSVFRALQLLQERSLDIPLIALSEPADEAAALECLRKGAADYLLKDRLARLGPALGAALAVKKLRDSLRVELASRQRHAEEALQKANEDLERKVQQRTAELQQANQQLSIALQEREQAQEEFRQRFSQLQAVYQLTDALRRAAAIEEICEAALNGMGRTLARGGPTGTAIFLFDSDGILRLKSWRELSDFSLRKMNLKKTPIGGKSYLKKSDNACVSNNLCRAVEEYFRLGDSENNWHPLLISNVEEELSREPLRSVLLQQGIRSVGFIPLIFQGRQLGKYMLSFSTPHSFSDREVLQAQAIASHIAFALERKQAEASLIESEERFRRIFDEAPIGMSLVASDSRLFKVNRAFCEMLGYTARELARLSFADITHPEDLEKEMPYIRQILRGELDSYRLQKRYIAKNREILWVNLTATVMRDPTGEILYALAMVEDVSDRFRAEEALRSSEEQFRQLAENIRQVFWISSLDNRQLLYVSPAYEEIWGRTCQSLYQQPLSWLEAVCPQDRDALKVLNKSLRRGCASQQEFRIALPDGSIRWIWNRAFPIRNESGEIYRIAGIAEDITDRKHAEAELRKALETEKELNELKSRFVSMVSHEFRNPLTSILMSVKLLDEYGDRASFEKKRSYLQRIKSAAKQMTNLLESVLLVGRVEAGKLAFDPEPIDLEAFCRALVEDMQLSAGHLHVITFVSPDREANPPEQKFPASPTSPVTSFPCLDEKLLWHILSNLLSNAIKYSPQGGTVQLTLSYEREEAVFEIADEGIGIPAEDLPHLFESFHRAANVGKIPGTGLGLAIVKKAVDIHGGKILVRSQVGGGTTFTVKLPLAKK